MNLQIENSQTDQQLKADLNWCLHSQPLISPDRNACYPTPAWFADLPDGIATPDIPARRLGIRFEQFITGWVKEQQKLELLAHNLPVRDETRTIGEFDLLVRNAAGEVEHWELACKFYLSPGNRNPDAGNMGRWHGPNPTDTLHDKINRLETHQLRLASHPAAAQLLAEKNWQIQRTRALIKGRLFYPIDGYRESQWHFPSDINPAHERGWWMSSDAFHRDADAERKNFAIVYKINWLSELSNVEPDLVMNHAALCEQLSSTQPSSLHVAVVEPDSTARYQETSRGFIVSNNWLEAAGAG